MIPLLALLLVLAATAVVASILARSLPRVTVVGWTLVLFFVPVWVSVSAGIQWTGIALATVLLVIGLATPVPLRPADGWMAAFVLLILGLQAVGAVDYAALVGAGSIWVLSYLGGRVAPGRVEPLLIVRTIAVIAVVAAALALLEVATGTNPFVRIPGAEPLRSTWTEIQTRGGLPRAEGALGHSIALGTCLAMSSAFVIGARWRLLPTILGVGLVSMATVVTFSRAGLITLVLTLALATLLQPDLARRTRVTIAVLGTVCLAAVVPLVWMVLGAAGSEASGSAGYRADLWTLLRQVSWFGNPGDWTTTVTEDGHYLGTFAASVDNAVLLMLLRYGMVPTALLLAVLLCAIWALRNRLTRSPAAIAVAGQVPALFVVDLITQYGVLLWFCVGLTVAWAAPGPDGLPALHDRPPGPRLRAGDEPPEHPDPTDDPDPTDPHDPVTTTTDELEIPA